MLYVVIDTNIIIRALSQGKSGCEMDHLRELKALAEKKTLRLLLPEMVQLEVAKHWRAFPQILGDEIGRINELLEKLLDKPKPWSEVEDVKPSLLNHLSEWKEEKRKACEDRYKEVEALLSSSVFDKIPLTGDVVLNAKRRLISGRMPKSSPRDDQDACIVESLIAYFRAASDADAVLYFCSENADDFAVELPAGKGYALDPLIGADLPKSCFFINLASTVAAARELKPPPKPTPEELAEAVHRQDQHRRETGAGYLEGLEPNVRIGPAEFRAAIAPILEKIRLENAAMQALMEPVRELIRRTNVDSEAQAAIAAAFLSKVRGDDNLDASFTAWLRSRREATPLPMRNQTETEKDPQVSEETDKAPEEK